MSKKNNRTSPIAPVATGETGGMAQKFMRENPVGKLTDPPEIVAETGKPFAGDVLPIGGETPEAVLAETLGEKPIESGDQTSLAEGEAAGQPGEAAAPPTPQPQAEATDGGQLPQAAQPQAAVETPKPVETPSVAKLDREGKYELIDGVEWTGEQILASLQQRAELIPKSEERDKFAALFGSTFEDAQARWKPVLDKLAANPARTQFLEAVLGTDNFDGAHAAFAERLLTNPDPALLDYLVKSEANFYDPQYGNARPTQAQPTQPAAQPSLGSTPEGRHLLEIARGMEQELIKNRANGERSTLYSQYPFLQTNEKARQAIFDRAAEMYALDEKNGVPLMQRRGLLDAMTQQKLFLDSMAIAHANAAPRRVEPKPGVGPQALLTGTGPGAAGTARPAPPREYRGDPDKARDQFLTDYPD